MKQKEKRVIYTFYTTAAAMQMEKACQKQSIPGKLIATPRQLTADCGIAWSSPVEERQRIAQAEGMPETEGIYELEV